MSIPPEKCENDYYHFYCVSLMLMQFQNATWEKWNASVREYLLKKQRKSGDSAGSWDPDQKWGDRGGRAYSTAMACLTLQVYYRYLPMHAMQRK